MNHSSDLENIQDIGHEFQPIWVVDEAQIKAAKSFSEFASNKLLKVKVRSSEYKVVDSAGKEEIVKAECAQMAAQQSSIKDPKMIMYLENCVPTFLNQDFIEA